MHVHQPDGVVPSFSDGDVRSYLRPAAPGRGPVSAATTCASSPPRVGEGRPPAQRVATSPQAATTCCAATGATPQLRRRAAPRVRLRPAGRGQPRPLRRAVLRAGRRSARRWSSTPAATPTARRAPTNWRVHFRGTAAHNTVCVDGQHQTRYEPRPIKDASRHATGSVRHKIMGRAPITSLVERIVHPQLDLLHGRCIGQAYDARHDRSSSSSTAATGSSATGCGRRKPTTCG